MFTAEVVGVVSYDSSTFSFLRLSSVGLVNSVGIHCVRINFSPYRGTSSALSCSIECYQVHDLVIDHNFTSSLTLRTLIIV